MNIEIEHSIRKNVTWSNLPQHLKQNLGNSQKEYEKLAINYSIKNQLRYKGNLVRTIRKDERRYYEELLKYSREHLMLYPYHLSDVLVKGLRMTPFAYYTHIMTDIMTQEKSYDSLPNFTAADCLRLMAIGRNQYIDIMNQCRSSKKFFRKKPLKDLLPRQPVESVLVEPWWVVHHGYIIEEDIKICSIEEKRLIDRIIDNGPQIAGYLDFSVVHGLYRKGLVYLDVPIDDDDHIIVPPLEGFVMNRVLGDYFETLLYKIFVSIDEHTSITELAKVLEIDLQLVKNAVSMFCRLGFGRKKNVDQHFEVLHDSWNNVEQTNIITKKPTQEQLLIDWSNIMTDSDQPTNQINSPDSTHFEADNISLSSLGGHMKRIALMFDSTLTAFLMMGNLSPGLKSHAVTMFEVGKLSDESLDCFLTELEKVDTVAEGEAQRYFDHAVTLRDTVHFLRHNRNLVASDVTNNTGGQGQGQQGQGQQGQGLDLLRCESLLGLDAATCSRVLNKNYSLLISVAPLSNEVRPVSHNIPHHLGPAIPEVNSIWFKLFLYSLTSSGPPSLLLSKGTKLRKLPKVLQEYDRILITTWGHDPSIIPSSNILLILNDALSHSAILVQGHGTDQKEGQTVYIPFPLRQADKRSKLERHTSVELLYECIDLNHTCGYITMLKTGRRYSSTIATATTPDLSLNDISRNVNSNNCTDGVGGGGGGSDADRIDSPFHPLENSDKIYRGKEQFDLPTPTAVENGPSLLLVSIDDHCDVISGVGDVVSNGVVSNGKPGNHGNAAAVVATETSGVVNDDVIIGDDDYDEDDWLLLDCCFGVPLFDRALNMEVCARIQDNKLCREDSLRKLSVSNKRLTNELLKFVHQNQEMSSENFNYQSVKQPNNNNNNSSNSSQHYNYILPTQNLIFQGGKLSVWDGV